MSASTDLRRAAPSDPHPAPPSVLAAAWRPAGLLYLAACLAGLAAGLYPEAIYPSRRDVVPAPLPALQALATAQVLFILIVHPLIVLRRADFGRIRRYGPETIVESVTWLIATVPLYVAAAYLADATATDVLRTVLYVACLWPVAWAAGAILRRCRAARAPLLLLLLIVAAGPALFYVLREFMPLYPSDWLWQAAPATAAWDAAASRAPNPFPQPLWSLLLWPAFALCLFGASLVVRSRAAAP